MTLNEAKQSVGRLVRVAPTAFRGSNASRHFSRGKLVEVGRKTVRVQLFGGGEEDVDPQHVRIWHAKEPNAPVVLEDTAAQQLEKQMNGTTRTFVQRTPAPAAEPTPTVPATPPALSAPVEKPALSDVLGELTTLVTLVKNSERELADAETKLQEAEKAKAAAEESVMEVMGRLETIKSRVRAARTKLDTVMEGV